MAFQFIHVEAYSRKADNKGRSCAFIFAEASRRPSASCHVSKPLPPIVSFGIDLDALEALHETACEKARVSFGAKSRKIRSDQKSLFTVVASHPLTMEEVRAEPLKRAEAEKWECLTIEWLRDNYGSDLKSVIRHEDETHFHLHAYVVPDSDSEMRAIRFHPGVVAKREVMAGGPRDGEEAKALSKRADEAYKQSMRNLQDDYFAKVATRCGLTRLGPKKRRLTRAEWHAEKTQAQALKSAVSRAERLQASSVAFVAGVNERTRAISALANEKARRAENIALQCSNMLRNARREKAMAADIVRKAAPFKGIGGAIRAMFDGLQTSRIYRQVEAEWQKKFRQLQDLTLLLDSRVRTEEAKRQAAERQSLAANKRAQIALDEAARMRLELDRALSLTPRWTDATLKEQHKPLRPQ